MELATSCGETRTVFFDTNFFRSLLKGDFDSQFQDSNSDLRAALQLPFKPRRTPFSFMEWIGLNTATLPKPTPFDLNSVTGTEFIVPAYQHYEEHYGSVGELDREHLEALSEAQRSYVSPRLMDIWDTAVGGIFGMKDISGWLRFSLAFDALHKLDPPATHRADYWSDLIAGGFFKADYQIRNLSKFRLAYQMWHQTRTTLTQRGTPTAQRQCIEETQKLLSLGNWKDYLDGDLVHAAAYGVEESDGTRHRVVCLTCDRPEVVTMRIRLYKGLLSYVHKVYKGIADSEGFPEDYESSHNGEIFCFDQEGILVQRIDVASETPALLFLVHRFIN